MSNETLHSDAFTRLHALRSEFATMTPAQRGFIKGEVTESALLVADEPATRLQLREQERRLAAFESRVNSQLIDVRHKAQMQDLDLSSQTRSIDALAARVRRLESDAPIKEILVVGLAGVLFVSLVVAIANAAADPI